MSGHCKQKTKEYYARYFAISLWLVVAVGCQKSQQTNTTVIGDQSASVSSNSDLTKPTSPPKTTEPPIIATQKIPPAASATATSACVDPTTDISTRNPSAKPHETKIDIDGDGTPDQLFSGYCSMMGGNCDTYIYASNQGCPKYLGTVMVTQVSSGPHCVQPAVWPTPCKLSATRMMIHGELYEYFYIYGPSGYQEAGVGHMSAPRHKR